MYLSTSYSENIMWFAFYWILHRKRNFRQIYTNRRVFSRCVFSIYSNVI